MGQDARGDRSGRRPQGDGFDLRRQFADPALVVADGEQLGPIPEGGVDPRPGARAPLQLEGEQLGGDPFGPGQVPFQEEAVGTHGYPQERGPRRRPIADQLIDFIEGLE